MASEHDTTPIPERLGIHEGAAQAVRVLVMTGYGLNCEAETSAAFRMLGAQVEQRHVGDLMAHAAEGDPAGVLDGFQILAFVGGFAFGDHVASGRVLANRLRYRLGESIARFVDRGGLAVGMCNGFQTMVKLGLLPGLDRPQGELATQTVSLVDNQPLGYRDAWVRLGVERSSPCVWTRGLHQLEVPSRHAEGRMVFGSDAIRERLVAEHLIPLAYLDDEGNPTEVWPANPNGSAGGAAALCDPTGRIFGLMPHPEAYLYPENHPHWRALGDAETLGAIGDGLRIYANGVRAVLEQ